MVEDLGLNVQVSSFLGNVVQPYEVNRGTYHSQPLLDLRLPGG